MPHSIYPDGYHCEPEEPVPFLSLANQKSYIGFYHMGIYTRADLLGELCTKISVREWIETYEREIRR